MACSTAAAIQFIDSLQPTPPLVFPTAEEVEADNGLSTPNDFGPGFDPDDLDSDHQLSDSEIRALNTFHQCTFCDNFVTGGWINSAQFVMTISRTVDGQISASIDFLRCYSEAYRGFIDYHTNRRPCTSEIHELIIVNEVCESCRLHLQSVVFPAVADSWSRLNVDNLSLAGGVVTCREAKRVRLAHGVKTEPPEQLHKLFDVQDLLGIIAQYANPLASVFSHPMPSSAAAAAAFAPLAATSVGSKRALCA